MLKKLRAGLSPVNLAVRAMSLLLRDVHSAGEPRFIALIGEIRLNICFHGFLSCHIGVEIVATDSIGRLNLLNCRVYQDKYLAI
jgi:hypothetical protein